MNRPRVVIYTRVSTDDQADYGTGLETQQIECARYAERLGAVVVAIESDPGVSGTLYPREGLERALSLLESGQADTLLAHRVDRIGRKLYIPPLVHERIKAARCRLFTVDDGEVTDQNIIVLAVKSGMAETDYTNIVRNMKAGKRRRAEAGQMPARTWAPYGYRIVQKSEESQTGFQVVNQEPPATGIVTHVTATDVRFEVKTLHEQRRVA
jgi:site-specific DNA recombinase